MFWQSESKYKKELDRLHAEHETLKTMYTNLAMRDLVNERTTALEKQVHILGERALRHDHMMLQERRLRATIKEVWPRDLEIAEETNLPLIDLAIWLMRGKPGPEMPKALPVEGTGV